MEFLVIIYSFQPNLRELWIILWLYTSNHTFFWKNLLMMEIVIIWICMNQKNSCSWVHIFGKIQEKINLAKISRRGGLISYSRRKIPNFIFKNINLFWKCIPVKVPKISQKPWKTNFQNHLETFLIKLECWNYLKNFQKSLYNISYSTEIIVQV